MPLTIGPPSAGGNISVPSGIPKVLLGFNAGSYYPNGSTLWRIGTDSIGQLKNTGGQRFKYDPIRGFKLLPTGTNIITTSVGIPSNANLVSSAITTDDGLFYMLCNATSSNGSIFIYDHDETGASPNQTLTGPSSPTIGNRNSQSGDYLATTSDDPTHDISIFKNVAGTWGPSTVDTFPPIYTNGIANVKIGNSGDDLFVSYLNAAHGGTNRGLVEYRSRSGDSFSSVTQDLIPPIAADESFHDIVDFDGTTLVTYQQLDVAFGDAGKYHIWTKPSSTWVVEQSIDVPDKSSTKIIGDDLYILDTNMRVGHNGAGAILHYKRTSGVWAIERLLTITDYGAFGDGDSNVAVYADIVHLPSHNILACFSRFSSNLTRVGAWDIS